MEFKTAATANSLKQGISQGNFENMMERSLLRDEGDLILRSAYAQASADKIYLSTRRTPDRSPGEGGQAQDEGKKNSRPKPVEGFPWCREKSREVEELRGHCLSVARAMMR